MNPSLAAYQTWFAQYTVRRREELRDAAVLDEFDMKKEHTLCVQALCEDIARWLALPEADCRIASLCGLFHDLGRFEQAVRYGTMDDRITGSHADLSLTVFNRDVPPEHLDTRERDLIITAVRCHNLFKLPEDLPEKEQLFAKITRDADKLDIFRHTLAVHTGRERRGFRFVQSQYDTGGEPAPELLAAAKRGENVDASQVRNKWERMLLEISLVYDLNFGYSFRRTRDMGFVPCIAEHAEGRFTEVAACAEDFMKARLSLR